MRRLVSIVSASAALLITSSAHAAIISQTYDLTATGFGAGAPYDPVELNFTLTFDNSASIDPTTTGLTVKSFTLPYGTEYAYDAPDDSLTVGTYVTGTNGNNGFSEAPNSYGTFIGAASTPTPSDGYGLAYKMGNGPVYNASAATITASGGGGGGPEPSSWALMMIGVFGTGAALRQRRCKDAVGQPA